MVKAHMEKEMANPLPCTMTESGINGTSLLVVFRFDTDYNMNYVKGFLTALQYGFKIVKSIGG